MGMSVTKDVELVDPPILNFRAMAMICMVIPSMTLYRLPVNLY
jgi:hypothetical protein